MATSVDNKVIRCAEIKTIPTITERKSFRIGEYNRATASFEMKTPTPPGDIKPDFDLTDGDFVSEHYFQSSFARSVASGCQSKSLDYGMANRSGKVLDEADDDAALIRRRSNYWHIPGQENWRLRRVETSEVDEELASLNLGGKAIKNFQEPSEAISKNNDNYSQSPDYLVSSPSSSRCAHERSQSSSSEVDAMLLQSQVTTLQWQLRQTEASRQMHRAVLEQIVVFLKKAHKELGLLQGAATNNQSPVAAATLNRVPRSRSIHSVDASPTRYFSSSDGGFQRAKSVAQIPDPHCPKHGDAAFRGRTWFGQKREPIEELPNTGKLSEEAFRLLRTAQCVLNTREPDLTARLSILSGSSAEASSASSTVSATLESDSSNLQSQETLRNSNTKMEDLQAAFGGNCSPIPGLPAANLKDATMSLGRRRRKREPGGKGSPTSSADDESGFSSLTSSHCQELVGSQHLKSQCDIIHEEIGLPAVGRECRIHRRWSAMPADHLKYRTAPNGLIKVLWV